MAGQMRRDNGLRRMRWRKRTDYTAARRPRRTSPQAPALGPRVGATVATMHPPLPRVPSRAWDAGFGSVHVLAAGTPVSLASAIAGVGFASDDLYFGQAQNVNWVEVRHRERS